MTDKKAVSPAKRKRLLKTYGPCPAGYTQQDIERLLDVLYGMFSNVSTSTELQQMMICNPFDHADVPRPLKLVDFTAWLESLIT